MKKLFAPIIGLVLASVIGCSSSADSSGKGLIGLAALKSTGQVSFSFDESSAGPSKSIAGPVNAPAVTALVVTITDASNNTVYNAVSLPVTALNGQYITQPLTLAVGSYHLTSFAAVNASGTAIYASPLEGSALAYLVSDPLPINFSVTKNQVSKLVPEVLGTASYTAGDFGYSTFNFDIVETIDFLTSVIAYNETSSNYELTTANITVASGTTTLYTGTLPAAMTAVKVRDGYTSYTVTITKSGFADYTHTFTNAELKAYTATPLMVTLTAGTAQEIHTMITTEYSGVDNSTINKGYSYNEIDQYPFLQSGNGVIAVFLIGLGVPSGQNINSITEFYLSTSAGTDGTWLTEDDTLAYRYKVNPAHNSMEIYSSPAASSMTGYMTFASNAAGYMTGYYGHGMGTDTVPYTSDDVDWNTSLYVLNSDNLITHVDNYSGMPGSPLVNTATAEYNGLNPVKITFYGSTWDHAFSVPIDQVQYVKTIQYDTNGRATSIRYYSDDEITQIGRVAIEYNPEGKYSKISIFNGPGTDGLWGTGDDVIGNVLNPLSSNTTIAYAYGNPFSSAIYLPVATFEYNAQGINFRTNGYTDNGVTLTRYNITEYN